MSEVDSARVVEHYLLNLLAAIYHSSDKGVVIVQGLYLLSSQLKRSNAASEIAGFRFCFDGVEKACDLFQRAKGDMGEEETVDELS